MTKEEKKLIEIFTKLGVSWVLLNDVFSLLDDLGHNRNDSEQWKKLDVAQKNIQKVREEVYFKLESEVNREQANGA